MKVSADNRVLIITTRFPPQDFVGVYRMYRLVKNLPRLGWKPYVLTVDTNYEHHESPELLDALPDDVEIHRVRYIEPSARGLRMALGGKDRRFAALYQGRDATDSVQSPESNRATQSVRHLATTGYRRIYDRWLNSPDLYWTWYRPALKKARRLVAEHDIPLVLTSAPDFTSQRIASRLHREGVRWIADFRDPPVYMHAMHSSNQTVYAAQQRIENAAIEHADQIATAAIGIGLILTDMYGLSGRKGFEFIPTGLDDDFLADGQPAINSSAPYLLFPGTYIAEYGSGFLEVLGESLRNPEVRDSGLQMLFVGTQPEQILRIRAMSNQLGIAGHVRFLDRLPQRQTLALIRDAAAGVLMPGPVARWWSLHAKAVEYMGMRKRVVAMVPEISESRYHLEKTGLGVFLDGDRKQAATTLANFILGRLPLPEVNQAECERFTASRQAESFSLLFEQALAKENE